MKLLFFDSYLSTIRNSVGTKSYQTLWAETETGKKDIIENGRLACALFVSGVLKEFNLIKERHATVSGTLKDMQNSGWYPIKEPKEGCVIHWDAEDNSPENTEHLGFFVGGGKAISNDRKAKTPQEHNWDYRRVLGAYWNSKLENKYFN